MSMSQRLVKSRLPAGAVVFAGASGHMRPISQFMTNATSLGLNIVGLGSAGTSLISELRSIYPASLIQSMVFGSDQVRSREPQLDASKQAEDLFAGYEEYACRGWDGYDGEAIKPETVRIATDLVKLCLPDRPLPDAAPSGDGTIGLEWWNGECHFFVDVTPDGSILTYLDVADGEPSEEQFKWGEPELASYLGRCFAALYGESGDSGARPIAPFVWAFPVTSIYVPAGERPMETFGSDTSTTPHIYDRTGLFTTPRLLEEVA